MQQKQRIVLVRHGETDWSLSGKHTGRTDIPLTEKGKLQAQELSSFLNRFSFKKAFVSPLQRAKTTFLLSKLGVDVIWDTDLYEWDYGDYEGLTKEQIRKENPSWSIFNGGAPNGESTSQIETRADRMIEKAQSYSGDVVFFSSGHILRSIACRFLMKPISLGKHLLLSTASVSILSFDREDPVLSLWNHTLS